MIVSPIVTPQSNGSNMASKKKGKKSIWVPPGRSFEKDTGVMVDGGEAGVALTKSAKRSPPDPRRAMRSSEQPPARHGPGSGRRRHAVRGQPVTKLAQPQGLYCWGLLALRYRGAVASFPPPFWVQPT